MKKQIAIKQGYYIDGQPKLAGKHFDYQYIEDDDSQMTNNGTSDIAFYPNLPTDIDIFSELPKQILEVTEINAFFKILKRSIWSAGLQNVTLAKLRVSEFTEKAIMVDWIFNYFRVYFDFEMQGDSSYGMIENNPIRRSLSTCSYALSRDKYPEIADTVVKFVIQRINGIDERN